jgi:zinc protease
MSLAFTKTTLPNGLQLIVHEDHRLPLTAVSVWYHVGSKNEVPGQTGLAHLFEHLMFEASLHQPRSFFEAIQEAGGSLNGSTNPDRTNYWEVVPRGALERALWMEADRMGWMLPALSDERFETQRGVVLNERRQNYENRGYGLASFLLSQLLYPPDYPYHWPTIGRSDDLHRLTADDAREFLQRFYHPANASLAIAGDVTMPDAAAMVERLFGDIPAGPPAAPVVRPLPPAAPARVYFEDRVELPRLYMAWPTAPMFHDDDAPLELAGDLLANGRTSRLYQRLTHRERIASELAAAQTSRELCGSFQIVASASPGRTLDECYAGIVDELRRLTDEGPTEVEMERGRAQAESSFVFRLESLGGFGGRADQLNAYNVFVNTPDYFEQDLRRYLAATPAQIRAAVATWLHPDRAVLLSIVPQGKPELALAGSAPAPQVS